MEFVGSKASLTVLDRGTEELLDPDDFFVVAEDRGIRVIWCGEDKVMPDGNYSLSLAAESVVDAGGVGTDQVFTLDFHVLAGDADRDRDVDFFDFLILRGNYGTTNKLFSDGDSDYDGDVDFFDFLILRGNYGLTLPPPEGSGSLFDDGGGSGGGCRVMQDAHASRTPGAPEPLVSMIHRPACAKG